jgi:hypothetical protein
LRRIAIHTGGPHCLDHLGILSIQLGLPLLVTEEETYQAAKKFYPLLNVTLMDLHDLTLEFLASYDVIFNSATKWALELIPVVELLYQKRMRMVYCPHGNSDKTDTAAKDISLFYGPHMREHLEQTGGRANSYIRTGNFRYAYYLAHQEFYDRLLQERLKLDRHKKTIFYAPTWPDGESRSSFALCNRVIEEVGEFYNLIIRWHPFLDEIYPAQTQQIKEVYRDRAAFLDDFPCIYPILSKADGYLGDFSSIGYDFLTFNKPLFFLDNHRGVLHKCGIQLPIEDHLGKTILKNENLPHFKELREKAHHFVFGDKKEIKEIEEELQEALSLDRASWNGA